MSQPTATASRPKPARLAGPIRPQDDHMHKSPYCN